MLTQNWRWLIKDEEFELWTQNEWELQDTAPQEIEILFEEYTVIKIHILAVIWKSTDTQIDGGKAYSMHKNLTGCGPYTATFNHHIGQMWTIYSKVILLKMNIIAAIWKNVDKCYIKSLVEVHILSRWLCPLHSCILHLVTILDIVDHLWRVHLQNTYAWQQFERMPTHVRQTA